MSQIEVIAFRCKCGQKVNAKVEQAGRSFTCPKCGESGRIPTFSNVTVDNNSASSPFSLVPASAQAADRDIVMEPLRLPFGFRVPSTFGELTIALMSAWAIISLCCLVVSFFSIWTMLGALLFFLFATGLSVHQLWKLAHARQQVLHHKDVSLFWGFVRLVAWDPTEGILLLRNKSVAFADDDLYDSKGGIRFIYPILGEELGLRVPLEVQTLRFSDDNVLTNEYLTLSVRGTMKWRISNVRRFYLLVSRELRSTSDTGRPAQTQNAPPLPSNTTNTPNANSHDAALAFQSNQNNRYLDTMGLLLRSAIEWLRILAEEQTRTVVSGVRSGLLVADRLASELPELRGTSEGTVATPEFGGATTGLAASIKTTLVERVREYGITIDDVSLQEIKLPEEILRQCIEAARAAYLPLLAQRNASVKKAALQAEVDVLGKETIGTKQIVEAAPGYSLTDFLTEVVRSGVKAPVANRAAAAIAGAAARQAIKESDSSALPPPPPSS